MTLKTAPLGTTISGMMPSSWKRPNDHRKWLVTASRFPLKALFSGFYNTNEFHHEGRQRSWFEGRLHPTSHDPVCFLGGTWPKESWINLA